MLGKAPCHMLARPEICASLSALQKFWLAGPPPIRGIENDTGLAFGCEEHIDGYDQFEHIDVAAARGTEDECLVLSIRRDPRGTLLRMITEGPGSLHLWAVEETAENGERIFDALLSGEH